MTATRGEIWLAMLDPTQGSEQAGTRPVLILQHDSLNKFTTTVLRKLGTIHPKTLATIESCVVFTLGIVP